MIEVSAAGSHTRIPAGDMTLGDRTQKSASGGKSWLLNERNRERIHYYGHEKPGTGEDLKSVDWEELACSPTC